jgi:hypothetical protein
MVNFDTGLFGKIKQPPVLPPTTNFPTDDTQANKVAAGSLGRAAGAAPPPQPSPLDNGPASPEYQAIVASVLSFMPAMSDDATDVLLAEATMKMQKLEAKSDNDQVTTDTDKKRDALAAKEEKIKESEQKIQDALSKTQGESIWDKVKIAFEAIGSVLACVIGAALVLTGAGAALGLLMIAGGVLGLVMTADAITTAVTGESFAQRAFPNDPKAQMGFEIGMACLGVVIAVAGLAAGISAFSAAADVVEVADAAVEAGTQTPEQIESAVNAGEEAGQEVANSAQQTAKTAEVASNAVNAATTLGQAGGDVYYDVMNYEATNENADAKDLQADAKRMEAVVQMLDGLLDIVMQHMKSHIQQWDGALDSITSAMDDRNQSLMRAKLGI